MTREHGRAELSRRALMRGGVVLGVGLSASSLVDQAAARPNEPHIALARNGRTEYTVYLGSDEDAVVRQAAQELAEYLKSITSATFPVVSAAQPPDGHILVIGRKNPLASRVSSGIDYEALGDDGFALRTAGQTVFISGPQPRGTLYGVYWLLDRLLGVRWFSADYTRVPHTPDLDVPIRELNRDEKPRFRYREMYAGDANSPAYRQHNLLNGCRGQYQKIPTPDGLDTWSSYWPDESFGGSFHTMVPDQSLWFGGQLKCMDPATRSTAAANLIAAIDQRIARGDDPSYGFTQVDAGWTPDPQSKAFADAHGGALSAPVVDMVNDVAARVRAKIPQARLSTQAYQFSFKPPTGLRVSKDVVLTVAPIEANFAHSLFAGDNTQIGSSIKTWCGIADNVVLWDYLTDFVCYIQPFPDWWAVGQGIKTLARLPAAQGYFGEGAYNTKGAEFAPLRTWVISRLLWDPTLDIDALIREFLGGYFGPAADSIYEYMKLMVKSVADTSSYLTAASSVGAPFLRFETMRQADALLDTAESRVRDDRTFQAHVQTVRLAVDYVILMRSNEFQETAAELGISWDPDRADRLRRFEAALGASGLTYYNEVGGTPDQLTTMVRIASSPASPPKTVAGLPSSDWRDYQEPALNLYPPATTVLQDGPASNQYTVRMPGNRSDWAVQLRLDALPAEGTWKLYASVRVDTATADPASAALYAGVYPPLSNATPISVSELSDGHYHEIPFPGTYQHDDSGALAYIAPPNSPQIPYVYVDRIFAVRER